MAKKRIRTALTAEARLNLIIGLTTYLSANFSRTVAELAEHFEVEEDEIRRAVSSMIRATTGSSDTGWDWALDLNTDWREDDTVDLHSQLILDGNPRLAASQAAALASGLAVLASVASPEDKLEIQDLIDVLRQGTLQSVSPTVAVVPGTIDADFAKIRQAISAERRVSFEYLNSKNEMTEREFDPIRLESNDQIWNARGYCHLRQEERSFRLDRMRNSKVLEAGWSDEARALELTDDIYVASDHDTKVTLEVSPEAYDLIGNFNAELISSSGKNDEIKRVEISVGYLPNLGKMISVYGGAAKVIAPEAARTIVRDFALKALGRKPLDSTED